MNFWRTRNGIITMILLMALGAVGAWRIQSRAEQQSAQETKQRIERDVKQSINNATKGIKLCPLSNPDCDKR
jgi:hypothetical protein